MKGRLSIIATNLVAKIKSFVKINFQYPKKFLGSQVGSVLVPRHERMHLEGVRIEKNVIISDMVEDIGKGVFVGTNTIINTCQSIGNFSSISRDVKVGLQNHPQHMISTNTMFYLRRKGWVENDLFDERSTGLCSIGHDVLISSDVLILSGVNIGTGAIIGAGAVVTKDVPPYAIAVGIPARVIGYRFDPSLIQRLLESEWWNVPTSVLKEWHQFFDNPEKIADLALEFYRKDFSHS